MTRKVSFHDLEPGDIVAAYGTTLEVRSNRRHTLTPDLSRTIIVWQDLQPERHRTYREPWDSGLRLDIEEAYLVTNR
jgi:hypothetical protein